MIKKTKFTPGPWESGEKLNRGFYIMIGPRTTPDDILIIGCMGGDKMQTERDAANARLIAAAPELYVMMLRYQSSIREECNFCDVSPETDEHWEEINTLLKTIQGEP